MVNGKRGSIEIVIVVALLIGALIAFGILFSTMMSDYPSKSSGLLTGTTIVNTEDGQNILQGDILQPLSMDESIVSKSSNGHVSEDDSEDEEDNNSSSNNSSNNSTIILPPINMSNSTGNTSVPVNVTNSTVNNTVPQADLTISGFNLFNPVSPSIGNLCTFNFVINNIGTANANNIGYSVNMGDGTTLTSTSPVTVVVAGQTAMVSFTHRYTTSGNYNMIASVDYSNQINESSEVNNQANLNLVINP